MQIGISLSLGAYTGGGSAAPSYDYTVTDDAELAAVIALGAATLAGKTVGVEPGVYTDPTINGLEPASLLTFVATGPGVIWDQLLLANFDNLRFEGIEHVSSDPLGYCVRLGGSIGRHEFGDGYKIHGGYHDYTTPLNPTDLSSSTTTDPDGAVYYDDNRYPEQANIIGKISGGTLQWLHITRKNIGTNTPDQLADGVYNLSFDEGTYTYLDGNFAVDPVATMTVVAGVIVSTNIVSPGSGGNNFCKVGQICSWEDRVTYTQVVADGVTVAAGYGTLSYAGPAVYEDGEIYDLIDGIKYRGLTGGKTCVRNDFYRLYIDIYYSSNGSGYNAGAETFALNRTWHPMSAVGDSGDPHSDAAQWTMMGTNTGTWSIDAYGNIAWVGVCRGEFQGWLVQGTSTSSATNGYVPGPAFIGIRENVFLVRNVTKALSINGPIGMPLAHNLVDEWENLSQNPTLDTVDGSWSRTYIEGNLVHGFGGGNLLDPDVISTLYGNSVLGSTDRTTVYADFNGAKDTLTEVLAAFAPEPAYAAYGPLRTGAPVDFAARTINLDNLPVLTQFTPIGDITASATATSNWSQMLGGPATFPVVPGTGTEVRFADDDSGTNATSWTSSSTTGTRGKFTQVRRNASATGSATVQASATYNGVTRSFSITTIAATNYPAVSNGGTAYSSIARPATNRTNINRILVAWEARRNGAQSADPRFFATATLTRFNARVSSTFSLAAIAGATFSPAFSYTVDENWHRYVAAIDFTQTSIDAVVKMMRDGGVRLAYASGNVDVAGTVSTTSDTLLASALGIFDESDGGSNVFVGEFRMFWLAIGSSNSGHGNYLPLPDVTDPSVCAGWSFDNINQTTGEANGIVPNYALWGDAAAWNAGLANKGTESGLTLTKQAGTYTDV